MTGREILELMACTQYMNTRAQETLGKVNPITYRNPGVSSHDEPFSLVVTSGFARVLYWGAEFWNSSCRPYTPTCTLKENIVLYFLEFTTDVRVLEKEFEARVNNNELKD